jgi:YcaO-like protein with predicted kinase domain
VTSPWTDLRTIPCEETVRRARAVATAFGITRVANVTGLDHIGIPVVMVCRPAARSLSVSQGKGLTLSAAQASGLMESIELHHAERITLPVRLASYRDLARTANVADPVLLSQPRHSRFTPDTVVPWVRATGVRSGEPTWVPYQLVDLDRRLPHAYPTGLFTRSSNGLASGNTRQEAIAHGIGEVIERDAEALFHLATPEECAQQCVDVATIDDPVCRALVDKLLAADLAVKVSDRTTDLGVACLSCVISDHDYRSPHAVGPALGAGCHPDRRVALVRAITEAAQSRLTFIAGSRDDIRRAQTYEAAPSSSAITRFVDEAQRPTPVSFRTIPTFESDLRGHHHRLLDAAESAGFGEPLVVDLSACDAPHICPAAVVKVIVPGLEGGVHIATVPGPRATAALQKRDAA